MSSSGGEPIAHVRQFPDGSWAEPQKLREHALGVSSLAQRFGQRFASGDWALTAALLHDMGKATTEWQEYFRKKSGYRSDSGPQSTPTVEHSIVGAKAGEKLLGTPLGRFLSYCIAGHHAGLADWSPGEGSGQSALSYRLKSKPSPDINQAQRTMIKQGAPNRPPWRFERHGLDVSLWVRMVYSCLVDADFLDTERYMDPERAFQRQQYAGPAELLERLNAHIERLSAGAPNTEVNRVRRIVHADCRRGAAMQPGFFSLTVPTGGGKTLSSMAFALEHAAKYGLDRVIYVIPYTSIIEQNADVFRQALGQEEVIEHHSALDDGKSTEALRLASENWDATVIVTTNVQFLESLFAARPSRCRKLHNIARSVVVFDEAQLLPVGLLQPVLECLRILVDRERYGCSVLFTTATQPAFESTGGFEGLPRGSVREIVGDVEALHRNLERVHVKVPGDLNGAVPLTEIAARIRQEEQVLCIVSDRRTCREVYDLVSDTAGTYHLSALMCGQHRSDKLGEIKRCLKRGQPVRVVSTQLIEAGVDVDFPVVLRALAGLDSIAQAAGRCNREGRLKDGGCVEVFVTDRVAPPGMLRKAAQVTTALVQAGREDLLAPECFAEFFRALYWQANTHDECGIMTLLEPTPEECGMQFRTAAERFRLIDSSNQRPILVPYGHGTDLIGMLAHTGPERWLMRRLQRYSVTLYAHEFEAMVACGAVQETVPGVWALCGPHTYSAETGVITHGTPYNPEELVQ